MSYNFRIIGKFCFLLILIGFFMPVACQMNGFQLADTMIKMNNNTVGILLYLLFASALAGLIIGVLLHLKKSIPVITDWSIIIVCIGCGIGLVSMKDNEIQLQLGAYVILIGYIATLVIQIISTIKKE